MVYATGSRWKGNCNIQRLVSRTFRLTPNCGYGGIYQPCKLAEFHCSVVLVQSHAYHRRNREYTVVVWTDQIEYGY